MKAPIQDIPYIATEVPPPGETLRETLDALDMSQVQFAQRCGLSTKHVNQILQGQSAVTPETALLIERVTGVPARFWNALESDYRDALGRAQEEVAYSKDVAWLDELPMAALRKLGHVLAKPSNKNAAVRESLQFFGVSSVEVWRGIYANPSAQFLQSSAFEKSQGAIAAWLRLGEIEATRVGCASYSKHGLKELVPTMRRLTAASAQEIWPALQEMCAAVGVAVVLVPDIPGTRASGATRWLTPNKAMIQLSNRGKRNDKFWFAFFHEIGHVLLHGKKDVFFDDEDVLKQSANSAEEREANEFAANTLIPKSEHVLLEGVRSSADVRQLASALGVGPGIVAGRLQHDRGDYRTFSTLFERYELIEES
ncbi:putative HTH-type transcriptional regulator YddM [Clavibacter michiganensis subsp. michiganensis]|uniref:Plasmid maintenance system, antidote protein n=1 Tax=Clavibacter michiganensis subsp. michiganensis (strain NCPPB 382) TaxID=443906 RepID=A5CUZ3_CLAM3|nr:HigA family addiction module antitoxin [Clavibacter michiganensis]MDO4024403.1 HigA family addiction module antitoxin [Clavibacter michiganensis]MDO4034328.1 HigA family addiction module antitoxin [Clavibacter michiganensis]MDO4046274.1 HigA family addiction module antitoxin [Clavibacter michiganensis]MDO4105129.1 HigA family addiction module antitoxin [Clavibacter michiganensis]MDO4132622.1 HigA family addiction module antitoxin [Clavibacter michiganensis]